MSDAKDFGSPGLPLDGSVVKMKGLPFKATPEDVLKFFSGFALDEQRIYLKRHSDGRPNGEAFVVFDSPEEARRATQKDRETFGEKFGERYVRVYPTLESDVADMQIAVLQQQTTQHGQANGHAGSHGHNDSVVKIKSLPFDATQLDMIQFFESFRLKPNGVQLVVRSDNKPTGEAFVDFESPEEAARSIREKDHKVFAEKFGDRYVRLIQVSRKEMQATLALRFGGEGILKMKGIPFKASAVDVRKFFSLYKIKPEGISFIMHADGRPTGMAFIEFETPQEAVRAMEKDRAKFGPEYGDRFCMLQLVGKHEMEKVTLQRESENNANKLLNGINVLQAAAFATQAALNNPALQPILSMAGANAPWLNPMYQNLINQGAGAGGSGPLAQMGQMQGVGNSMPAVTGPMLEAALANLNMLNMQQHQQATLQPPSVNAGSGGEGGWGGHSHGGLDPATAAAAANNMFLLQAQAAQGHAAAPDWVRDPRSLGLVGTSTNTLSSLVRTTSDAAVRHMAQERAATMAGLAGFPQAQALSMALAAKGMPSPQTPLGMPLGSGSVPLPFLGGPMHHHGAAAAAAAAAAAVGAVGIPTMPGGLPLAVLSDPDML